ncbi:MAG: Ig-like domain-containing protein [Firmicutes bacterium]|nr:Ig-like domain-containing protein [Bacillota bacterium]
MIKCTNCGASIKEGARTCEFCGGVLPEEKVTAPPPPPPSPAPPPPQQNSFSFFNLHISDFFKNHKKATIIVSCVAFAVIVLSVVLPIVWVMNGMSSLFDDLGDYTDNPFGGSSSGKAAVDSVALNRTDVTLEVGDIAVLSATVTVSPDTDNNRKVKWSSSDIFVASVDASGVVTAKKTGTATITATSSVNSAVRAACEITVPQDKPMAKDLVITEEPVLTLTRTQGNYRYFSIAGTVKNTFKKEMKSIFISVTLFDENGTALSTIPFNHKNLAPDESWQFVETNRMIAIATGLPVKATVTSVNVYDF